MGARFALAAALMIGAAFLTPAKAGADHDMTCHPTSPPPGPSSPWDTFAELYDAAPFGSGPSIGALVHTEGAVSPFGALRNSEEVLLPQADGSTAQCGDANGNGVAGITGLEIALAGARTGRPAVARLRIAEGQDLDATGLYRGTLEICVGSDCTSRSVGIRAVLLDRSR